MADRFHRLPICLFTVPRVGHVEPTRAVLPQRSGQAAAVQGSLLQRVGLTPDSLRGQRFERYR